MIEFCKNIDAETWSKIRTNYEQIEAEIRNINTILCVYMLQHPLFGGRKWGGVAFFGGRRSSKYFPFREALIEGGA